MATKITGLIEETIERMGLQEEIIFLPGEKEYFEEHFEPFKIKKGDYLLKKGDSVEYCYYLEDGLMKISIPDSKGGNINTKFIKEKEFINFYKMHLPEHIAHYSLKASSNCKVWKISRNALHCLFDQSLNFNKLVRMHMDNSLNHRIEREEDIYSKTAEERYNKLLKNERSLFRLFPLKELASYIGITPQALSKIRRKTAR